MSRTTVIAGKIAMDARNDARLLALELENDALARLAVLKALHAAYTTLVAEWGAAGWLAKDERP